MDTYYTFATLALVLSGFVGAGIIICGNAVPRKRRILIMCSLIMAVLAAGFEWIGAVLDGMNKWRWLHVVAVVVEFSAAPIIPVLFGAGIGFEESAKKLIPFLAAHVIIMILSGFFGLAFSVDETNTYHRGVFYPIYIIMSIVGLVFVINCFLRIGKEYQNPHRYMAVPILGILIFGTLAQFSIISACINWLCVGFVIILAYMYYVHLVMQIDPLTKLLNRASYNNNMRDIQRRAIVLYFDVDKFKKINDIHGHSTGDSVLKRYGHLLKSVYGKYGSCYRLGGDEFCVVLTKRNAEIENLDTHFRALIADEKDKNDYFPGYSEGASIVDPERDDNIAEAVKRADKEMYREKRAKGSNR